ncbi:MAG: hypothetical protein IJ250_00260 [Bacteroidales bacterium]|nr:hypothetical protein [Bacteroidales bacterium]
MKKYIYAALLQAIILSISMSSCINEEKYSSSSKINLQFSSDTVSFDTLFTTVGSITKQIRVLNPENEAVKLDYITLAGGTDSYFRLNVDGDTSLTAKNVVIGAKDSIFIFIRAELDVNNQSNPLLIEDSIIFVFNQKQQSVVLNAYGQDAYFHKNNTLFPIGSDSLVCSLAHQGGESAGVTLNGNTVRWKSDKPHVIVGNCVVQRGYTLQIDENTKIHMCNGASLVVDSNATLDAQGTVTSPVVFQPLRTQDRYADIPGQWGMLWFMPGSKDNKLYNAVIKNATIGMLADTCVNNNHTVELKNTVIANCSSIGLYARGADIYAENTVVCNTGSHAVALTLGGSYEFIGCSIVSYWNYNTKRSDAALLINDYYTDINDNIQLRLLQKCDFHNTVVYGSLDNETELDILEEVDNCLMFDHCLLRTDVLNDTKYKSLHNCQFNKDPMFADILTNDLFPSDNSPLIGNGNGTYNSIVPYDIYGTLRLDPPCIGAIENRTHSTK